MQISESHCGRAIRTKKWKYSIRAPEKTGQDPDSEVYVEGFLYDLEQDPHERHDLVTSPDHVEIRQELADILTRRMLEAGEQAPEIRPVSEYKEDSCDYTENCIYCVWSS